MANVVKLSANFHDRVPKPELDKVYEPVFVTPEAAVITYRLHISLELAAMVGMHVVKLTILLSDVRGEPRIDVVMLGLPMVRPVWFVIPIVIAVPETVS